ncbi:MAG: Asp-tRNA(Asn)/Glu-tRNA(Gln) amidotransferase GatCAB subunit C [Candidatus Yanofskybacteria bacterium CG10_big_fil_rev_8_21_14_0_10_46_23]|uniref:Aspartyl/glutamyl-tRNA(Asn/Gln) amidotransferase subunit C n=1 Tax=Candidatus Yanofskybacteria bacterium CG10_big_fil_rev_8_21_14_0_10_46_23 TaxID=1975098 RepID=A0A2H0R400_9BACT|nr:MAG: Asp-tRNA(Asn)/Glu-tRNA(Gln) amidotransferase GatCAB subunit C [Candidatus Yanofskybacteria bacterium CG10_big_fil_rev_8_21_14_0_10_46_23]
MAFSKEDIKHIAGLARLRLTAQEEEDYTKEVASILNFVDQLQAVKTDNISPLYQVTEIENVLRPDGQPYPSDRVKTSALVDLAPDKDKNYVRVKAILSRK